MLYESLWIDGDMMRVNKFKHSTGYIGTTYFLYFFNKRNYTRNDSFFEVLNATERNMDLDGKMFAKPTGLQNFVLAKRDSGIRIASLLR